MNTKWIVLIGLGLFALQAKAEQPVVIDAQMINGQAGAANANTGIQDESSAAAQANRERVLKGGKMSPKQRHELAMAALSDSNEQSGKNFLAANKIKPGVISLPSGVQYKVMKAGKGRNKPTDASVISCRYQGTLVDGTSFEKTDAKKPEMLHVAGLLPGLKEAVELMTAGSRWQIVVPPLLAYGTRGNRNIGPNAVLIYDMEILAVK